MGAPQITFAYPTNWPLGRPHTPVRKPALFNSGGKPLLFDYALGRLQRQSEAVTRRGQTWRMREMTLSTNFELRADGRPRRDRGTPTDPSVAPTGGGRGGDRPRAIFNLGAVETPAFWFTCRTIDAAKREVEARLAEWLQKAGLQ
jgi:hypothetical protein